MPDFHEVQLPPDIAYGVVGDPGDFPTGVGWAIASPANNSTTILFWSASLT